jgi:magnesium-transporting ATPase (P-type)
VSADVSPPEKPPYRQPVEAVLQGLATDAKAGLSTTKASVRLKQSLAVGDRANNAVLQEVEGRWIVQGDPTEGSILVAARKAGLASEVLDARFTRLGEVPFSSDRKLMTTVHTDADRQERLRVWKRVGRSSPISESSSAISSHPTSAKS